MLGLFPALHSKMPGRGSLRFAGLASGAFRFRALAQGFSLLGFCMRTRFRFCRCGLLCSQPFLLQLGEPLGFLGMFNFRAQALLQGFLGFALLHGALAFNAGQLYRLPGFFHRSLRGNAFQLGLFLRLSQRNAGCRCLGFFSSLGNLLGMLTLAQDLRFFQSGLQARFCFRGGCQFSFALLPQDFRSTLLGSQALLFQARQLGSLPGLFFRSSGGRALKLGLFRCQAGGFLFRGSAQRCLVFRLTLQFRAFRGELAGARFLVSLGPGGGGGMRLHFRAFARRGNGILLRGQALARPDISKMLGFDAFDGKCLQFSLGSDAGLGSEMDALLGFAT